MARPVNYDPQMVLDQAMRGFWQFGYDTYDIARLTQTAGISRHSLYRLYGDKAGLFRVALAHYIETIASPWIARLEKGESISDLFDFFRQILNAGYERHGCLVARTVFELGGADPQIGQLTDAYYQRFQNAFEGLLRHLQRTVQIRQDVEPKAVAALLVLICKGLGMSRGVPGTSYTVIETIEAMLMPEGAGMADKSSKRG